MYACEAGWMPGSSPGMTPSWSPRSSSIHRHAREFHHLAPFLGLIGDELAELRRRHRFWGGADFGQPRHQFWILQRFADGLVESFHDLGRRALWRRDAVEADRLESRHGL